MTLSPCLLQAGVKKFAVGVNQRSLRVARAPQPRAHTDKVLFQLQRGVVLELDVVLVVALVLARRCRPWNEPSTTIVGAFAQRDRRIARPLLFKPRLIDQSGLNVCVSLS